MDQEEKYDSFEDTINHINLVKHLLGNFVIALSHKGLIHDASKLESHEKEGFDRIGHKLKTLVYGSDEYKENLKQLKPILDHHYQNNSHHPEHYPNGISGMDLLDLVEMFFDWVAATKRTTDGDMVKSIDINKTRFNLPDELVSIFKNTLKNKSLVGY